MFKVIPSKHGGQQLAVELTGLTPYQFKIAKQVVLNNYMPSDDYKKSRGCSPFLQGNDEHSGWIYIEFWTYDRSAIDIFVEHLNKRVFSIDTETHCRCGAKYNNSDHCDVCFQEQYQY